jgi:Bifunctional DNA primase/polymerase, N-terminal
MTPPPAADRDRIEPFLGAALRYAGIGWPVFPLRPRDKTPLIAKADGGNGCRDATTDAETITAWWARWPEANIGLAAGAVFWAFDVDYGGWDATEPDGLTSLAALTERYGPLPPTVMQITGGGGYQYFFQPDERVQNAAGILPGLDARSTGGYVVAPPSIHPDTGATYRWRGGHGPGEIEIAQAPEWLIALAEPVELPQQKHAAPPLVGDLDRYGKAALDRACDAIRRASFGQQADTLDRQAYGIGRLVAGGVLPAGDARAALEHAGRQMTNQPRRRPWTPREIAWRIDRAFAQATHAPRTAEAR